MYRYWLFGVLLLWKTISVANTAAIGQWELRFALHQTLETALISPLNLFKLSEVFFPRRRDVLDSPVSVQVSYNLTCQKPAESCSLQTEDDSFCDDGGYFASFFWTSLPINRTNSFTFSILESFSQQQFGRTVALVELSLEVNKSLPCGTSEQDVRDELLCISTMLKAYAKEQGVPLPNSNRNLKGFVSDYNTLPRGRGIGPSFHTFINLSKVLLHCLIFLTFLNTSYYIYKAVYENGKKNPIYGAYWATVLFSINHILVTLLHYEKDAIWDPALKTFLVLEFFFSILKAIIFTCSFKVFQSEKVLPIPLVSITYSWINEVFQTTGVNSQIKDIMLKICQVTIKVVPQVIVIWLPVATLHVFLYNILPDRVEVFLTNPLEIFIESVFYLLDLIGFFVVLNLPFYIKKPQCCIIWELAKNITNLLNIGALLAFIYIIALSTRYLVFTLSQSPDSGLLVGVLPSIAVTALLALMWPYVKRFIKKLCSRNNPRSANNNSDAETNEEENDTTLVLRSNMRRTVIYNTDAISNVIVAVESVI